MGQKAEQRGRTLFVCPNRKISADGAHSRVHTRNSLDVDTINHAREYFFTRERSAFEEKRPTTRLGSSSKTTANRGAG